jgi:hypothetical protein
MRPEDVDNGLSAPPHGQMRASSPNYTKGGLTWRFNVWTNVLIVVEDLDAVIAFFVELGMELEGKGPSRSGDGSALGE